MYRLRHQLPPLSALPAFEASARLLSFTEAAEELYVTQPAISRQIRVLEENLGVRLFDRKNRKIRLTEDGQRFQHVVSVSLDQVSSVAHEIRGKVTASDLTIAADISMAYLWLLPRFPKFRSEYPDIAVSILASDREADCLREDVDLALLYGNGNWQGFEATLLIQEEIFPVCSKSYLDNCPPIDSPDDLVNHVLLDLRGERWDWVDWRQWLTEKALPIPSDVQFMAFNSLPLLIEATCQSQGIGLGWGTLVDELLENGSLVRPIDMSLGTDRGYYVIRRANQRMSSNTHILFNWVIRMSKKDRQK